MSTVRTSSPDPLDDLLSADQRAAILAPIGAASTFPALAYTSPEFLQVELDRVFRRNWVALCFSSQVPHPGDVIPLDEFGCPLVVVRQGDGSVAAFHNLCPYDGCPVATDAQSDVARLRSAYHGWEYDLAGVLQRAPHWDGTASGDPTSAPGGRRDLTPVRSYEFLGVVFVALSDEVGPFTEFRGAIVELLAAYDLECLAPACDREGRSRVDHEPRIESNWKTFVENDCLNVLHEGFVHAVYQRSTSVPRTDRAGGPTFAVEQCGRVLGFSYEDAGVDETYPEPDLPPLSKDGTTRPGRGYFLQVFPNLSLMVRPNYVSPLILTPDGPGAVSIRTTMLVRASAADGALERLADVQLMLDEAGAEDAAIIESIQWNRRSPVAGEHFYAPFWDEPHHLFNQMVLNDLTREARALG